MEPQEESKKHSRTVSWDQNALEPPTLNRIRSDSINSRSQRGTGSGTLTVEQVANHGPRESDSETQLHQKLDRRGLLEDKAPRQSLRNFDVFAAHTRTNTANSKFYDLVAQLNEIHLEHEEHLPDDEVHPLRDRADTLDTTASNRDNAAILYHHVNQEDELDQSNGSARRKARKHWGLVRDAALGGAQDISLHEEDELSEEVDENINLEEAELGQGNPGTKRLKTSKKQRAVPNIMKEWMDFYAARRSDVCKFFRLLTMSAIPLMGTAAILFYIAKNPPTGRLANNGQPINGTLYVSSSGVDPEFTETSKASASWWFLFVFRLILTFSLAKIVEFVFIDFLAISSGRTIQWFGNHFTLFILQAKGWPFLIFIWALLNLALLSGTDPFFSHWGFWQDYIDLFNESNPSGNVVTSEWNRRTLILAIVVGIIVSIKRYFLSMYFDRKTYSEFSGKLESLMRKILLIGKVASLARDIEHNFSTGLDQSLEGSAREQLDTLLETVSRGEETANTSQQSHLKVSENNEMDLVIDPTERHPITGSLSTEQKIKIQQLLGSWEEPVLMDDQVENVSIDCLLQFRRGLAFIRTAFPFSGSFGRADSRSACIESSQETYRRLMLNDSDADCLSFDTISSIALSPVGDFDKDTLRDLIRIFRPDRDGSITLLDFVKSVDTVYKQVRILRASVANSSKLDRSTELIVNFLFHAVLLTVILSQLGFDPLALFLSISGVVLAFAFMISSASSKYFEGLLFILVRRPYQIGDGIHISNVESNTSTAGEGWWTVEDVGLFTTSVIFSFTNERATYSNGSLANSRIINSSRSGQAYLWFTLKFPISTDRRHLDLYKQQINEFMHKRPREWLGFIGFRVTGVDTDMGCITCIVIGQHTLGWEQWGTIQVSKSDCMIFAVELQKKMGLYYRPPAQPIDFNQSGKPSNMFDLPQGLPSVEMSEDELNGFNSELQLLQHKHCPGEQAHLVINETVATSNTAL